jgi:hypothetical protein
MSAEVHAEPEEIVDADVPVDAFLKNIGTHVPDVSSIPETPGDENKDSRSEDYNPGGMAGKSAYLGPTGVRGVQQPPKKNIQDKK